MTPERHDLSGYSVRHAVAYTWARGVRLLHERTILVLLLLFGLGMGCMLWYVSRQQSHLMQPLPCKMPRCMPRP